MRHSWQHYTHPSWGPSKLMGQPHRQCDHCGAIQYQSTETSWMRVTGHRWLPLVGRCAGVSEFVAWGVTQGEQPKGTVQARHQTEALLLAAEQNNMSNQDYLLTVERVSPAPVKKRNRGTPGPRVHLYNYAVTADPLMPEHVREQYDREGIKGTACGYVRPLTTTNAAEVTCTHCLREIAKAK